MDILEKPKEIFKNTKFIEWLPDSPGIDSIENLWPIIKKNSYENEKQYSTKDHWEARKAVANNV